MLLDNVHLILPLSCVSNIRVHNPYISILEHNCFSHNIFLQGPSVVVILEYFNVVGLSNSTETFSYFAFSHFPVIAFTHILYASVSFPLTSQLQN